MGGNDANEARRNRRYHGEPRVRYRAMMMARLWMVVACVCSLPTSSLGDQPPPRAEARLVPLRPLAADFEVIFGDPDVAGEPFVMRIRELPGTIIPPHSHPVDEHITVLEGTFFFAVSDKFDLALMKELKAGGYAFAPKGSTMFGASPDGAIVQVHGVGPFHIHWRDGQKTLDDPGGHEVFRFRKGDRVVATRGPGRIKQGYASGTHIQYEVELVGGALVMELESAIQRAQR
jgi:quercetin dioxygenase-like cupin family protein